MGARIPFVWKLCLLASSSRFRTSIAGCREESKQKIAPEPFLASHKDCRQDQSPRNVQANAQKLRDWSLIPSYHRRPAGDEWTDRFIMGRYGFHAPAVGVPKAPTSYFHQTSRPTAPVSHVIRGAHRLWWRLRFARPIVTSPRSHQRHHRDAGERIRANLTHSSTFSEVLQMHQEYDRAHDRGLSMNAPGEFWSTTLQCYAPETTLRALTSGQTSDFTTPSVIDSGGVLAGPQRSAATTLHRASSQA